MSERAYKLGLVAVWVAGTVGLAAIGEGTAATLAFVIAVAVALFA